jgi:CRP-like cAMP-binding protein
VPRSSATSHELARIELLAGLPGETLAKLAKAMDRQEVAPGSAIVREGESGDRFYVVFAGMLSVANSAM